MFAGGFARLRYAVNGPALLFLLSVMMLMPFASQLS